MYLILHNFFSGISPISMDKGHFPSLQHKWPLLRTLFHVHFMSVWTGSTDESGKENVREKTRTPQTHNSPLSLSKQNLCRKRPCWKNGTCQAGFTDNDFRCICPVGVRGGVCRKGKSTNEEGLPGLGSPSLENFTTSSSFPVNKSYCLPCQRTSYYYSRDISLTLTQNNHVSLFPPNSWEALDNISITHDSVTELKMPFLVQFVWRVKS